MDLYLTLEELKELNQVVSKPPESATSDDIDLAENEYGKLFPEEIKLFFKEASHIIYGCLEVVSLTRKNSQYYFFNVLDDAKQMGVPEDWIPICEDNSDFYCYTPDGSIKFWDHNGTNDESWPDLATWIKEVWIEGN